MTIEEIRKNAPPEATHYKISIMNTPLYYMYLCGIQFSWHFPLKKWKRSFASCLDIKPL